MRGAIALIALLSVPAQAAECAAPVDELAFRSLVLQSQAAVDRGDLEQLADIHRDALGALPCLGFAPEPRLWADFLLTLAIAGFARGEPWEPYLATALRIRPGIDRAVGSSHPLARWEPPAPGPPGEPLPAGSAWYVDGLPATTLPDPHGAHLVQRRDGVWWASTLVIDAPPESAWLNTRAEGPPRIIGRFNAGAGLIGALTVQQSPANRESAYLPALSESGFAMVHVRGAATFYSRFGVAGELMAPVDFGGGWRADLRLAAIAAADRRFYGVGVGLVPLDVREGLGRRSVPMAWPHVIGQWRGGPQRPWDLTALAGGRRGLARVVGQTGMPLPTANGGAWRIGAELSVVSAQMWVDGSSDWPVQVTNASIGLQIDRTWGEP